MYVCVSVCMLCFLCFHVPSGTSDMYHNVLSSKNIKDVEKNEQLAHFPSSQQLKPSDPFEKNLKILGGEISEGIVSKGKKRGVRWLSQHVVQTLF